MPSDPYNLGRFLEAQENSYAAALQELQAGQKRSHWMWFIFPQIQGLGFSPTAQYYAIKGLDEAQAYLAHPVLGPRLCECTAAVNAVDGKSLAQIFGYPDHLKFRSSMTLFELASGADSEFSKALDKYCAGQRDDATLDLAGKPAR
jgi:uncharacterized protein (DUF1810 family)